MKYICFFLMVGFAMHPNISKGAAPSCDDVKIGIERCERGIATYNSLVTQYQEIYDLEVSLQDGDSPSSDSSVAIRRRAQANLQTELESLITRTRSRGYGLVVLTDEWFKKDGAESLRYCRGDNNALGKFEECKRRFHQLLNPSDAQPSNSPSIDSGAAPQ